MKNQFSAQNSEKNPSFSRIIEFYQKFTIFGSKFTEFSKKTSNSVHFSDNSTKSSEFRRITSLLNQKNENYPLNLKNSKIWLNLSKF